MSNRLLDTPWPKLERGKSNFNKYVQGRISTGADIEDNLLVEIMQDGNLHYIFINNKKI